MLFDTHAHLDDEKFDEDREGLIGILKAMGVTNVTNVGASMKSSMNSINLAEKYDFIYATVGVHPHYAKDMTDDDLIQLAKWTNHKKVVAIGEIGLDYYYNHSPKEVQQEWFRRQLELAERLDIPVCIHDRDAHKDCIDIISEYNVKGIFHCFSGSMEMAKQVVKMGFYLSFGGPLTYKNAVKTVEAAEYAPMDRILIETDCPYLSPDGHRGERNNPSYIRITAQKLADIKGVSLEEIAEITTENAKKVYRI